MKNPIDINKILAELDNEEISINATRQTLAISYLKPLFDKIEDTVIIFTADESRSVAYYNHVFGPITEYKIERATDLFIFHKTCQRLFYGATSGYKAICSAYLYKSEQSYILADRKTRIEYQVHILPLADSVQLAGVGLVISDSGQLSQDRRFALQQP